MLRSPCLLPCVALFTFFSVACGEAPSGPSSGSLGPSAGSGGGSTENPNPLPTGPQPQSSADLPSENIVRRLTNEQYSFVISDLLGIELTSTDLNILPADHALQGFSNIASTQVALPEHASGYGTLAAQVAAAIDLPRYFQTHAPAFTTCQTTDAQCLSGYAGALLPPLFRRPPTADEISDYTLLMQQVLDAGAPLERAVRAAFELALQAPQFLYLLEKEKSEEPTGVRLLDDYELASRLSFALWGSAPDGPLLAEAGAGTLRAQLGKHAGRLMADPTRAARVTRRFVLDWLGIDKIADQSERAERIEGAVQMFQQHVWTDAAPLLSIYQKPQLVLTPEMAATHGLTPAGAGLVSYSTEGLAGRLGFLSQPGVIAAMDPSGGGAIVNRGLFILQRLYCAEVDVNPPDALRGAIESFKESFPEGTSNREIAGERLTRPECQGCHTMFDPLAFAFEQFDPQGNFRTQDEHGNVMTTEGWIPALASGEMTSFTTLEEFTRHLVNSEAAQQCISRKMVEYFIGKRLSIENKPLVAQVHQQFVANGETYAGLVQAITAHEVFTTLVPSTGAEQ